MKKSLLTVLILIFIFTFTLFGCKKNANPQPPRDTAILKQEEMSETKETEKTKETKETDPQNHTETDKKTETESPKQTSQVKETEPQTEPHVHFFGEWETVKKATCTDDGEKIRNCNCGETETGIIASSGHTPIPDLGKAATCTLDGLTNGSHCSTCNIVLIAQEPIKAQGHAEVIDLGKAATCTVDGLTDGSHCSTCNTVLIAQKPIKAQGHVEVTDLGKAATCTTMGITDGSHCSVCNTVLVEQTVIQAQGHNKITSPAKSPTCTEMGYTEATVCSKCNYVFSASSYVRETGHTVINHKCINCEYVRIDFSNVDIYASDYGYNYLGTLPNGNLMQTLYKRLDAMAMTFHSSNKNSETLGSVQCLDLGLKIEDVQLAVSRFIYDRPLYYWLEGGYSYLPHSSGIIKYVILNVAPEYSSGETRTAINSLIYKGAEEFYSKVETEESAYHTVLAYYDMLIAATDYSFESDGITPQDDIWAHRITGIFTGQGVVCEGYAKTLQLLLNVSGIENIYIIGEANGGHAWNLIRLDDYEWYWFDVTWDDMGYSQSTWLPGKAFFAVGDSTVENSDENISFMQSHVPDTNNDWGWPTLPERSDTAFDSEYITEALKLFTVGENTYQVIGYNSVHLVTSTAKGAFTVPETVLYNGRLYDVAGTGTVSNYGYTTIDSVFNNYAITELTFGSNISRIQGIGYSYSLTKVTISSSVKFIDRYAFVYCNNLKDIYFKGTLEEWNAIVKDASWKSGCGAITVHCSNGNVTV